MQYDDPAGRLTPFEYECLIKHSCFLMNSRSNGGKTAEKGGEMSDTPRTDAAAKLWITGFEYVRANQIHADFARQLERELAAALKDAERYRWLRDKSPGQFEQPIVVTQARAEDHMKYIGPLAYRQLDAAIDAAIAAEQQPRPASALKD